MKTKDILNQRQQTHGDYRLNAKVSQALIDIMQDYMEENWDIIHSYQRHSIMMICMKLGRIAVGDPGEPDHWQDIAGYAELVVKELEEEVTTNMLASSHPASYVERKPCSHDWQPHEGFYVCRECGLSRAPYKQEQDDDQAR
jgi:hypothetical protein